MGHYEFTSIWQVEASVEPVWNAIKEAREWPEWWPGVERVIELTAGNDDGLGAIHRSTWKSRLPYRLEFDSEVVRIEKHRTIEVKAFGELEGMGLWRFSPRDDGIQVRYDWNVITNRSWMNLLAPVARPFFKWNHDAIMTWGERGLRQRLGLLPS
ncbi:MAG: SRPBCC family protein [Acidobacteria bacterium]|nr:SRPBCC family protein [Acidobacteriota bacterium]